jgi:mannose-6-phosphate isomerase-like protein (cupin superfamily)
MCVLGVSTVLAQTAPGPTVPGYFQYSPAQLRAFEERLRPRMNSVKQAAEQLGDFGNHQAWVAHREGDGLAEIHQNWADLMFVISGEATLQIGGELDSPFIESPGEVRAPRATGGTTRVLREGDVANVPAGVPHRFLVREGGQITFFTMKIAKAR